MIVPIQITTQQVDRGKTAILVSLDAYTRYSVPLSIVVINVHLHYY